MHTAQPQIKYTVYMCKTLQTSNIPNRSPSRIWMPVEFRVYSAAISLICGFPVLSEINAFLLYLRKVILHCIICLKQLVVASDALQKNI